MAKRKLYRGSAAEHIAALSDIRMHKLPIDPSLLAPGMLEASALHDFGEFVLKQLVQVLRACDQDRHRPPLSDPPLWSELTTWGRHLPPGAAPEALRTLLLTLRTLHDALCPLLTDATGDTHHA